MEKPGVLVAEVKGPVVLSDLEGKLLERFKRENVILLENMNPQEKGALGKLAAGKLVEKTIDTTVPEGAKKKMVWKLAEIEEKAEVVEEVELREMTIKTNLGKEQWREAIEVLKKHFGNVNLVIKYPA